MVSPKLILAALAVLGCAQAAPQPKEVDVAFIVENIVKIVGIVVKAVDGGIIEADPILDEIGTQLPMEVADALKELRNKLLGVLRDVEDRVQVIIDEVEAAITDFDKIDACTQPISERADEVLTTLELAVLGVIRKAEENNADGLASVKDGVHRIVNAARMLFDESLSRSVKCLAPGAADARSCVDGVLNDLKNGITSIGADLLLFVSEVIDVLTPFIGEIVNGTKPHFDEAITAGGPLLQEVSDCLPTLG